MKARPLADRLHDMTKESGDCLEFTGYLTPTGYGRIGLGRTTVPAHRAAWMVAVGDPGDKYVLHHCDNRRCVNVDHLYLGDQFDNMRDMVVRDRASDGSISRSIVIRSYSETDIPGNKLAQHMGVSKATVSRIKLGRRWGLI